MLLLIKWKSAIIIDVAIPGEKRIIDKRRRLKSIRISKERLRDTCDLGGSWERYKEL